MNFIYTFKNIKEKKIDHRVLTILLQEFISTDNHRERQGQGFFVVVLLFCFYVHTATKESCAKLKFDLHNWDLD